MPTANAPGAQARRRGPAHNVEQSFLMRACLRNWLARILTCGMLPSVARMKRRTVASSVCSCPSVVAGSSALTASTAALSTASLFVDVVLAWGT
jgi:hypothetical protein